MRQRKENWFCCYSTSYSCFHQRSILWLYDENWLKLVSFPSLDTLKGHLAVGCLPHPTDWCHTGKGMQFWLCGFTAGAQQKKLMTVNSFWIETCDIGDMRRGKDQRKICDRCGGKCYANLQKSRTGMPSSVCLQASLTEQKQQQRSGHGIKSSVE